MTTLVKAMLEVARLTMNVHEGMASDGTTSTLIDTYLNEPVEYFSGGTLWMLSGDNDQLCVRITHGQNTLLLPSTLTSAIEAGDMYAVAPGKFDKIQLKQAILRSLREVRVPAVNTELVTVNDQGEYTLPDGVSNILKVEIEGYEDHYWTSHHWHEHNGTLYFTEGFFPDYDGNTIRIWYETSYGDIAEDADINPAINLDWLKWSAAAFLWRNYIQTVKKDDPIAVDMLNEAKVNEAHFSANKLLFSVSRTTKMAAW